MKRRHFLLSVAASGVLRAVPRQQVKITRITLTSIEGRFHKFVAYDQKTRRIYHGRHGI